jgi:shikimate kinase
MINERIYLTGFMGSGKSTIGSILANSLGYNYADIDKIIEKEFGITVNEYFQKYGETEFRKAETEILKELSKIENVVISLGGGTLSKEENLKIIKDNGLLIYLKLPPEILFERLKYKTDRPLIKEFVEKQDIEGLKKQILHLLAQREKFYNQSDLIIDAAKFNKVGFLVDHIKFLIENHFKNITALQNEKNFRFNSK